MNIHLRKFSTIYFRKAQEKSVFSQILQYIYTILLAYLEYLL